jgi:hypothetical protein
MAAFAAALTSAIPLVEKVVSAIWPADPKKSKNKNDANNAVAPLKQASAEALKSLSDQLSLVGGLLEACFPAQDALTTMRAVLKASNKGPLSDDDKFVLQRSWTDAKNKIKKMSDRDTVKAIRALEDVFTRTTFLKLVNASTDDIDADIKAWAVTSLAKDVETIWGYLDAVDDVAVQVTAEVAQGLAKLGSDQKKPAATGKGAGVNE